MFLGFAGLLLITCNTQSSSMGASKSMPNKSVQENSIVYVFFEIEKIADQEKVVHIKTQTTKGILKNGSVENKPRIAGNLLFTLLGKNNEIVEERIIEDPLNPLLEVYAEEGLSKNKLTLNKAEFSIRFNQKGNILAVKVEKITANSKKNLLTLKL